MREILFRGKAITGKWIYGYYEKYNGGSYINLQTDRLNSGGYPIREFIEVIPETVGQYTGLTDKNGTKIFEGDIVDYDYFGERKIGKIFFNDCGYEIENQGCFLCVQSADKQLDCEVIGNIHDNPELLKGGD